MENQKTQQAHQVEEPGPSLEKKPWHEPRLEFVEPKLTKHGDLKEMTAGFFGTFTPGG